VLEFLDRLFATIRDESYKHVYLSWLGIRALSLNFESKEVPK
jgi:hypothetical protein